MRTYVRRDLTKPRVFLEKEFQLLPMQRPCGGACLVDRTNSREGGVAGTECRGQDDAG